MDDLREWLIDKDCPQCEHRERLFGAGVKVNSLFPDPHGAGPQLGINVMCGWCTSAFFVRLDTLIYCRHYSSGAYESAMEHKVKLEAKRKAKNG